MVAMGINKLAKLQFRKVIATPMALASPSRRAGFPPRLISAMWEPRGKP